MCKLYIEKKIKAALCQSNLATLIHLLEGVIFHERKPTTPEELALRKETAFKELTNIVPNYMLKVLGEDFKQGLTKLLQILQNPLYNKQLAYSLLDIVLVELYPKLDMKEI